MKNITLENVENLSKAGQSNDNTNTIIYLLNLTNDICESREKEIGVKLIQELSSVRFKINEKIGKTKNQSIKNWWD
jgi:hypothetical protein